MNLYFNKNAAIGTGSLECRQLKSFEMGRWKRRLISAWLIAAAVITPAESRASNGLGTAGKRFRRHPSAARTGLQDTADEL